MTIQPFEDMSSGFVTPRFTTSEETILKWIDFNTFFGKSKELVIWGQTALQKVCFVNLYDLINQYYQNIILNKYYLP